MIFFIISEENHLIFRMKRNQFLVKSKNLSSAWLKIFSMVEKCRYLFRTEVYGQIVFSKMKSIQTTLTLWTQTLIFLFNSSRFSLRPMSTAKCRTVRSTFSLSVIFFVLSEIYELVQTNRKCTMR